MAKKRSQERSPSLAEAPKQKKMRTTDSSTQNVEYDDGWTKVERRKQKKTKKAEVRVDVCVYYYHVSLLIDSWSSKLQATQPRFMYYNAEIVKRNHAIGIDVCF